MNPVDWDEFADLYCDTQEQTPEGLRDVMQSVAHVFQPDGFLIAECGLLDSSYFGQRVVLPFGGGATLPEPPKGPFSPRGLASDQSLVLATIKADQIP